MKRSIRTILTASVCAWLAAFSAAKAQVPGSFVNSVDSTGVLQTMTLDGEPIDTTNPFFASLGINGRSCATCHVPSQAWSVTPLAAQQRFAQTSGTDPLFRTVDGSNSPNADVSTTAAKLKAYSMLLTKGLIRIDRPIPAGAEFVLAEVDDPYNYASAAHLSLFRRPQPTTNLRFITGVTSDERESNPQNGTIPLSISATPAANNAALLGDLGHMVGDAVMIHFQATTPPDAATVQAIVAFETNLATAQIFDLKAGSLTANGAIGGPLNLSQMPFYVSINDSHGENVEGIPFNQNAMSLFASWATTGVSPRASIARGEKVFNTKSFTATGLGTPFTATCSFCHDSPNIGSYSIPLDLDMGHADPSNRTADMPLYTLQNLSTGETRQVTDPGLALTTGQWADIAKFRVPVLRGLAARPPYFFNGSAADLGAVVDFYDKRFSINFTAQERADLIAFLGAL